MNPLKDIQEFHQKFGLAYEGPPRALDIDLADFRAKFGKEEIDEYQTHNDQAVKTEVSDRANYSFHLEHVLDALVDQMYVLMGTLYMHGMWMEFPEAWRRVHEANMKKVRAESAEQSKRGSTFDVVKPEGWTPPTHIDLVEINDRTAYRVAE